MAFMGGLVVSRVAYRNTIHVRTFRWVRALAKTQRTIALDLGGLFEFERNAPHTPHRVQQTLAVQSRRSPVDP